MLTGYVNSGYVKINKTQAAAYTLKKTPIRKKAGTTSYVKVKKKIVKLKKNAKITVVKEKTVKGTKWFYIKANVNKKTVKGWIMQSTNRTEVDMLREESKINNEKQMKSAKRWRD